MYWILYVASNNTQYVLGPVFFLFKLEKLVLKQYPLLSWHNLLNIKFEIAAFPHFSAIHDSLLFLSQVAGMFTCLRWRLTWKKSADTTISQYE